MISHVRIRNFQSLKTVDLELGPLTVIVGNSATGKSAFIRALKAVASNVRGTSLVTSGESNLSVSVQSQAWKITLEKGLHSNSYRVCDLLTGSEKEYTKLAGEVPEDVTSLLGIEPVTDGRSVNFAGERDQPYLLDESGQQVAKVLGDLTNVSTILEAIREGNRRRNGYSASVKVWSNDLSVLQAKLPKFSSLPTRTVLLTAAEEKLERAEELSRRVTDLTDAIRDIEYMSTLSERILPDIPDCAAAFELFQKMKVLAETAKSLVQTSKRIDELSILDNQTDSFRETLEKEFNDLLIELGECPTCHQRISSDHKH